MRSNSQTPAPEMYLVEMPAPAGHRALLERGMLGPHCDVDARVEIDPSRPLVEVVDPSSGLSILRPSNREERRRVR